MVLQAHTKCMQLSLISFSNLRKNLSSSKVKVPEVHGVMMGILVVVRYSLFCFSTWISFSQISLMKWDSNRVSRISSRGFCACSELAEHFIDPSNRISTIVLPRENHSNLHSFYTFSHRRYCTVNKCCWLAILCSDAVFPLFTKLVLILTSFVKIIFKILRLSSIIYKR